MQINTIHFTTAKMIANVNTHDFYPVRAADVSKSMILFFCGRICKVVASERYTHAYSGTKEKHHIIGATLREGKIFESVIPSDEMVRRISEKGMAEMPEEFCNMDDKPVLAEETKRDMIIVMGDRICKVYESAYAMVGNRKVVHIYAHTSDDGRRREAVMSADCPLEFPGQKLFEEKGGVCVEKVLLKSWNDQFEDEGFSSNQRII